jgi:regulator of replication initiation timing
MAGRKELSKDDRIKKEVRRLNSLFRDLGKDKQKVVKSLIENAAFMAITLEDLQDKINLDGVTSEYQNGENQWGTKKSPEVEVHIAMTKNFTQVIKQLIDMLPDQSTRNAGEELLRFALGGKK